MNALFRFGKSAVLYEPDIDRWLADQSEDLRPIVSHWIAAIRGCGDRVRELIHDGHPTFCVDDAAFTYVSAFTSHVNIGFFRGADLPDPARLLQGTGKYMRHVKLVPARGVDRVALACLIEAAYQDMNSRLQAGVS